MRCTGLSIAHPRVVALTRGRRQPQGRASATTLWSLSVSPAPAAPPGQVRGRKKVDYRARARIDLGILYCIHCGACGGLRCFGCLNGLSMPFDRGLCEGRVPLTYGMCTLPAHDCAARRARSARRLDNACGSLRRIHPRRHRHRGRPAGSGSAPPHRGWSHGVECPWPGRSATLSTSARLPRRPGIRWGSARRHPACTRALEGCC